MTVSLDGVQNIMSLFAISMRVFEFTDQHVRSGSLNSALLVHRQNIWISEH